MPIPYQTINATDTTNLYTFFGYINGVTSGMFMPLMLAVVWIVALIGSISEGRQASRAFIFASFLTSILAILLTLIGMLSSQWMYFTFILVAAGMVWNKLDNAPGI
jgi:hypothetical protein